MCDRELGLKSGKSADGDFIHLMQEGGVRERRVFNSRQQKTETKFSVKICGLQVLHETVQIPTSRNHYTY